MRKPRARRDAGERFWSYVEKTDGCWLWTGFKSRGYGAFYDGTPTPHKAHRYSWTVSVGPIPEGLMVCHSCDRPACVNPAHLFLGTQTDNMRDASVKGRLNVKRGKLPPRSRLDLSRVSELRQRGLTHKAIGREFGVCETAIRNALKRAAAAL